MTIIFWSILFDPTLSRTRSTSCSNIQETFPLQKVPPRYSDEGEEGAKNGVYKEEGAKKFQERFSQIQ